MHHLFPSIYAFQLFDAYHGNVTLGIMLLQVQNAIEYLKIIGALDENENLTVLGM